MQRSAVVIAFPRHRVRPSVSRVVFQALADLDEQAARTRSWSFGSAALFTVIEAVAVIARLGG